MLVNHTLIAYASVLYKREILQIKRVIYFIYTNLVRGLNVPTTLQTLITAI